MLTFQRLTFPCLRTTRTRNTKTKKALLWRGLIAQIKISNSNLILLHVDFVQDLPGTTADTLTTTTQAPTITNQALTTITQAPVTTVPCLTTVAPTIQAADLVVHLDFENLNGLSAYNGASPVVGCVSIVSLVYLLVYFDHYNSHRVSTLVNFLVEIRLSNLDCQFH